MRSRSWRPEKQVHQWPGPAGRRRRDAVSGVSSMRRGRRRQRLSPSKAAGSPFRRAGAGGVRAYKGIPYAAPPLGPLRWRPPQPVSPWDGVRSASAFGPNSLQGVVFDDIDPFVCGVSEDCLYLNVWTPAEPEQFRAAAGHGLDSRRRLRRRLGLGAALRRNAPRRARNRGRDAEPPPQRARLPRPSRTDRRIRTSRVRKLRHARSRRGAADGSGATSRPSAAIRTR